MSVTIYLNMLISHFLSTYNEETKLQREARETVSETSDINNAVDQINRAISGSEYNDFTLNKEKSGKPYKGNVCVNHCLNPHHPTYHFCGVSSKLYPESECPFVLEPTLRDQYGATNGYEPITVATQWLLDATLILDGHNNSSVNLDSSKANDAESEVANKDSHQGYSRRRRNTNLIGDIDKALKVLERVDAKMKEESETALVKESRLRRKRSSLKKDIAVEK